MLKVLNLSKIVPVQIHYVGTVLGFCDCLFQFGFKTTIDLKVHLGNVLFRVKFCYVSS